MLGKKLMGGLASCVRLTVVAVFLAVPTFASAALVSVDFDVDGGPTQAGYESFPMSVHTGAFDATNTYGDLTVRIANASSSARTRNRNAVTGTFASLSDLLHEWVGGGGGFDLYLTMPAGSYHLTTYWHDADSGLPDDGSEGPVDWDIDGVSQTAFYITTGDAPTVEIRTITSALTSDGVTPVNLYYDGGAAKLNGFDLTAIPEPAGLGLLGLALLGLRRRRC